MAKIGFIGVGLMGRPMASHLLQSGHAVRIVAHRDRAPVEMLLAQGATEAADPEALAGTSEVVFLCLPNSEVIEAVCVRIAPHLKSGALVIDTSTAEPASTKRLASDFAARGLSFADAPVTGGPPEVEAGKVASLVGAEADIFPRVEALVSAYSKVVRHFGAPGAGHTVKLLNNYVTQGLAAMIAEAFRAGRRAGVDWRDLFAVMEAGGANSPLLHKIAVPALDGDYTGMQFALANAQKDIRYATALLGSLQGDTAIGAAVVAYYAALVEAGEGQRMVSELLSPEMA